MQSLGNSNLKENGRSLGDQVEWRKKNWGREKEGERKASSRVSGALRGNRRRENWSKNWRLRDRSLKSILKRGVYWMQNTLLLLALSQETEKIWFGSNFIFLQVWTRAKTGPCQTLGLHWLINKLQSLLWSERIKIMNVFQFPFYLLLEFLFCEVLLNIVVHLCSINNV